MKNVRIWSRRVLLSLVMALACVVLFRDCAVVQVAQIAGSHVVGTKISIGGMFTSPTGIVVLEDLVVGNPDGFDSDCALRLGVVKIDMNPLSVFDKCIRIHEIKMRGLRFNYEVAANFSTNHGVILDNVKRLAAEKEQEEAEIKAEAEAEADDGEPADGESKKVAIKHLEICDNFIVVHTPLKGASVPLPMVPLVMDDIGNEEGLYVQECVEEVSDALVASASKTVQSAGDVLGDVGGQVMDSIGSTGSKALDDLSNNEALKGMGEAGSKAIDSVGEAGSKTIDSVGEAGSKTIDSVGKGLKNMFRK